MSFEQSEQLAIMPDFSDAACAECARSVLLCQGDLMLRNGRIELTAQGVDFVRTMDQEYRNRNIETNIQKSLKTPPENRFEAGFERLGHQKRRGPLRIGIHPDDVISVREHEEDMMKFAADPEVAKVHDLMECDSSDFCHEDMATPERKAQKVRLENLIAHILFEVRPDLMEKWQSYEERRTSYDKWVKDRDHLSFLRECIVFLNNPYIPNRIKETIRHEFVGKMFRDPKYFFTEEGRGMALAMVTDEEWPLLPAPESP